HQGHLQPGPGHGEPARADGGAPRRVQERRGARGHRRLQPAGRPAGRTGAPADAGAVRPRRSGDSPAPPRGGRAGTGSPASGPARRRARGTIRGGGLIVLDTSVLVDGLTGPQRSAPALRAAIARGERLVVPALVLYEWLRGPRIPE